MRNVNSRDKESKMTRKILQWIFKKQIEGVRIMKTIVKRRADEGVGTYVTGWQNFLMSLID